MTKSSNCCPSAKEIKQLQQLSKIFGTDLSNWSHTTPKDSTITMKQPKK